VFPDPDAQSTTLEESQTVRESSQSQRGSEQHTTKPVVTSIIDWLPLVSLCVQTSMSYSLIFLMLKAPQPPLCAFVLWTGRTFLQLFTPSLGCLRVLGVRIKLD